MTDPEVYQVLPNDLSAIARSSRIVRARLARAAA